MGTYGFAMRRCFVTVVLGIAACAGGVEGNGLSASFGSTPSSASSSASSDATDSADTNLTSSISAEGSIGSSDPEASSSGGGSSGEDGTLTTTATPGECGDGIANGEEACDGEDFGGQSCADFGFDDGILLCNPECSLITEGCRTCGDDMLSMAELCDGSQLGGETCQTQGYGGGTLGCAADCAGLDTSACTPLPSCGDGTQNGGEQCDESDLGGGSCESLGYDFGVLSCNAGACTYNTAACEYLDCGGVDEFCLFDENNPQSTCCPPGVGGNVFGLCVFLVCQ
jgi:hypothetical protein